ncbi:Lrp/AsnC family transcriptional regulator [Pyrodictium abyssi]|uniref:HTH arsR-type domain-containing protein n=1 Tax=Pyrodictium abyssi TaxID=54256 RepID=A0ABM8ITN1_9CREN|nr:hypothetical protein PABY_04760 [Pyrodictium abyssi]
MIEPATLIALAALAMATLSLARTRGLHAKKDNTASQPGTQGPGEVELAQAALDERDIAILELLDSNGPMGVSEIARRLGLNKSTAWRKLRKLTNMNIVERITQNGRPLYRLRRETAATGEKQQSIAASIVEQLRRKNRQA